MRVLITGITGFAGSHLADYILENHPEAELFGFKRWRSRDENIIHILDKVEFHDADIKDFTAVNRFIGEIKPEKIFHLAAQSFVPASWKSPMETLDTNIAGQVNLFEAVRQHEDYHSEPRVCCEGNHGKSIACSCIHNYHETTTGVELLLSCRASRMRENSASFARLYEQLPDTDCWWLCR